MNKWLQRTVGAAGVAGGIVLLAAGVAQADDGATVTAPRGPAGGLPALGQVLDPASLLGGMGQGPLGLPNPASSMSLSTDSLKPSALLGKVSGAGRHGTTEAGDGLNAMTRGVSAGLTRGVGAGLGATPVTSDLPTLGQLPLGGALPTDGLGTEDVVGDVLAVQDVLDAQPEALPIGGGLPVDGVTDSLSGLTGGLPTSGLTGSLPLIGGASHHRTSTPALADDRLKPATEAKEQPDPRPMPLPRPARNTGLPLVGGLTGGLPIVGGLTQGGLPGVGQLPTGGLLSPAEGGIAATGLTDNLPLAGGLASHAARVLPGDLAGSGVLGALGV